LKKALKRSLIEEGIAWEHFKLPVYLGASAIAETFATILLCPLEAVKIVIMTKKYRYPLEVEVSGQFLWTVDRIVKEGRKSALWRGLPFIMLRQVPYSCIKLASYDVISEQLNSLVFVAKSTWSDFLGGSRESLRIAPPALLTAAEEEDMYKPVGVQIISGIFAGAFAAVLSQPADVLLSKICGGPGGNMGAASCVVVSGPMDVVRVARGLGVRGCFAGLKSRTAMVSAMTAAQFLIYEGAKETLLGERATKEVQDKRKGAVWFRY